MEVVAPSPERVYNRNPHNYNFGKQTACVEDGHIYTRASLNDRLDKNYFEKFVDWINAPGNGQNVYKSFRLTIELAQEIFARAADSASLTRMSSLLGKLREGHAPLYWLSCTKNLFSPSNAPSTSSTLLGRAQISLGRVQAISDWLTATFLNIHIFAPVFNRTVAWTGSGMTCTSLVSDSIELYENTQSLHGLAPDQRNPILFKVMGCICAVAVGVFGVLALALGTSLVPVLPLAVLGVVSTDMKLIGSFWAYVRDPVIV